MKIALKPLELARLEIVRLKLRDAGDVHRAALHAMRISAARLRVARVGIWIITGDGDALQRVIVHDDRADREDTLLPLERWPRYADALFSRRAVAADDACTDPRTCELADSYLVEHGITSLLDVPLFLEGEVRGVVCHEHVGDKRVWAPEEIDFATSVADMLSALLEQSMRLSAEQQLREEDRAAARAHHLRVLARTAAGIGHDVNTILQAITLNAGRARSAAADAREAVLGDILEDCKRGARIVAQLRELDGPAASTDVAIDLGVVVRDMQPVFDSLVGGRRVDVDAGSAVVRAPRTDLERIVLNLVTNACEASRDGSAVRVGVSASAQGGVRLEVQDDGPGLDASQIDELFEPYFTTKGGRHGGLGLFVVQTLAARSAARVSVQSTPGEGTTFSVTWPAES